MRKLTPKELSILQHSLGLDQYGQGNSSRNYFDASGMDAEICGQLVTIGAMEEVKAPSFTKSDVLFVVTGRGKLMVMEQSPNPPVLSRSKQRYKTYLKSESDESFGDWLKNSYWDEYRRLNQC